jgi:hypothetical protein
MDDDDDGIAQMIWRKPFDTANLFYSNFFRKINSAGIVFKTNLKNKY